ncbi:MAG: coproporphyrinogen III oxidase [Pseudonocardiaceae bacterium]|nr:coproporphyrinogen III oxidase [Pseudonocardiaceae bacterium]
MFSPAGPYRPAGWDNGHVAVAQHRQLDGGSDSRPGSLPSSALSGLGSRPFGVYVHVPFCATRCGYCDFNTYTPAELGAVQVPPTPGAAAANRYQPVTPWLEAVQRELALAARVLGTAPRADTVFVGGGTPSLLGSDGLSAVLDAVRDSFGLAAAAEVTTEANPESTSPEFFDGIAAAGFTRVSLGMQSAAPHVLATLDRRHTPGRAVEAAREARSAGFEHVSLDLIYGTPGETEDDLRGSLEAVLSAGVDHVSAYALVVEEGTAMARRVARGELAAPDDDVLAQRYELLDATLAGAGLPWYEVSNWAASQDARCHHNLGYWAGGDWWGLGPGAHSHVGGTRWWNLKYPARYAAALATGDTLAAGREVLSAQQRRMERVMLEVRLDTGLALDILDESGRAAAVRAQRDGLLAPGSPGRVVLTPRGRLLADAVVRDLLPG